MVNIRQIRRRSLLSILKLAKGVSIHILNDHSSQAHYRDRNRSAEFGQHLSYELYIYKSGKNVYVYVTDVLKYEEDVTDMVTRWKQTQNVAVYLGPDRDLALSYYDIRSLDLIPLT